MLSALQNLVPILLSPNYNQWEPAMMSYLMSQSGQWRIIMTDKDRPTYYGLGLRTARKQAGVPIDPLPTAAEEEEDNTPSHKGKGTASMTAVTKDHDDDEEDNLDEIRKWDDLNNQAIGNIRLRLHYSI
jgi:hypothetical protein